MASPKLLDSFPDIGTKIYNIRWTPGEYAIVLKEPNENNNFIVDDHYFAQPEDTHLTITSCNSYTWNTHEWFLFKPKIRNMPKEAL